MTFSLIGDFLRGIADVINNQKKIGAFVPSWCSILEHGEMHPHLLHTSRSRNEDLAAMLNTVLDVTLISGNNCEQNLLGLVEAVQKIAKQIKQTKSKAVLGKLAELDTAIHERVFKKLLKNMEDRLVKAFSEGQPKQNSSDDFMLKGFGKRLSSIEEKLDQVESNMDNLIKLFRSFDPEEVKKTLERTSMKHSSEIAREVFNLKEQLKGLIDELKFDPDNPKPVEIRTEENSKQIL